MKDPRNYTLGELLDSTDQVIYRNAVSIHKRLRSEYLKENHSWIKNHDPYCKVYNFGDCNCMPSKE